MSRILENVQQRWSRRGGSEKRNLLTYLLAVLQRAALPLFRIELDPAFSRELPSADSRAQRINWDLRALETPRTSADRSDVAKEVVISCAAISKCCRSPEGTIAQYEGRLHRFHEGKREVRVYDCMSLAFAPRRLLYGAELHPTLAGGGGIG